jgi:hypothetical protein
VISDTTITRIAQFGTVMLRELHANEHKGDWEHWSPDEGELSAEMQHHKNKLDAALLTRDPQAIAEHAADLANFAMKAWELFAL